VRKFASLAARSAEEAFARAAGFSYIALVLGIMGIRCFVSMIQSDRERLQRLSTERKEIGLTMAKKSYRAGYVDQTVRA